ncbi:hypothetical protein EAT51_05770 [Pseudoxanthomonas winnipegensis]|uniref:hypothetical protein n=1 Tax=Pseudoxanthomonas winnipegensis TaxID=2480810 RepID=UPI00102DA94B|nr:hypothetical protein [Pseudoxanthomonas winnipegensis]TAA43180.1 hypothetical protein EAT51_05770 [Pseudoxanthomonas winnipegensis]
MPLPNHVAQALGCDVDIERGEFEGLLESLPGEALPWLLRDQQAREEFIGCCFGDIQLVSLKICDVVEVIDSYEYRRLVEFSGGVRELIAFPAVLDETKTLPTGASTSLAKAWLSAEMLLSKDGLEIPIEFLGQLLIIDTLIESELRSSDLVELSVALSGYRVKLAALSVAAPAWSKFTRFDVQQGALATQSTLMAGRLLTEVLSEVRVRWRFVSIYRIFEAAYLVNVKERLLADFMSRPNEVLAAAQEALASELASFQKVVVEGRLSAHFDLVRQAVDADKENKFLHAIKRSLYRSKLSAHEKGVAYCYKVRCAIVHAGQHDVVFDRFDDAEAGVNLLVPLLEPAILDLLGLRAA